MTRIEAVEAKIWNAKDGQGNPHHIYTSRAWASLAAWLSGPLTAPALGVLSFWPFCSVDILVWRCHFLLTRLASSLKTAFHVVVCWSGRLFLPDISFSRLSSDDATFSRFGLRWSSLNLDRPSGWQLWSPRPDTSSLLTFFPLLPSLPYSFHPFFPSLSYSLQLPTPLHFPTLLNSLLLFTSLLYHLSTVFTSLLSSSSDSPHLRTFFTSLLSLRFPTLFTFLPFLCPHSLHFPRSDSPTTEFLFISISSCFPQDLCVLTCHYFLGILLCLFMFVCVFQCAAPPRCTQWHPPNLIAPELNLQCRMRPSASRTRRTNKIPHINARRDFVRKTQGFVRFLTFKEATPLPAAITALQLTKELCQPRLQTQTLKAASTVRSAPLNSNF